MRQVFLTLGLVASLGCGDGSDGGAGGGTAGALASGGNSTGGNSSGGTSTTGASGGGAGGQGGLTVRIVEPVAGADVSGAVTVRVDVTDAGAPVHVTFTVDGETLATDTAPPFELAWSTCQLADGEHVLRVDAEDTRGTQASAEQMVPIANLKVAPVLRGDAAFDTNRLDWTHCGGFDGYRLFFAGSVGVGETSDSMRTSERFLVHRPSPRLERYFYRVGALSGDRLGPLSNEIELVPTERPPGTRICSSDDWCWDNGPPQGHDLDAIQSFPDGSLVAAGPGTRIGWNGVAWRRQWAQTTESRPQLWGAAPNDVWVASLPARHWNGSEWSNVEGLPIGSFASVWGTAANSVWIVGYEGVFHFNGQAWAALPSQALEPFHPVSIWASARNDLWFAGNGIYGAAGSLLHYDGSSWNVATTGHSERTKVWGAAPNNVWSVGKYGSILHFDGSTWSKVPAGTLETLLDVHGCSANEVWTVGMNGTVLFWNGRDWLDRSPHTDLDFRGVWCNGADDAWVVGERGEMLRWKGQWPEVMAERTGPLRSVVNTGSGMLVTGEYETVLRRDAVSWKRLQGTLAEQFPNVTVRDMHGVSANDIWAVGDSGTILHWDGTRWTQQPSVGRHALRAVWALAPNDVWAAGDEGFLLHFDGSAWVGHSTGYMPYLYDLWGASSNDVYAVGWDGILHYNGASWSKVDAAITQGETAKAIWGSGAADIWVIGSHEAILHWNGSSWTKVDPGVRVDAFLTGVHGSGPNDVWITATRYYLHWDGRSWTRTDWPGGETLWTVAALAPNDAWIGAGRQLQHWDGTNWTALLAVPGVRNQLGSKVFAPNIVYSFGDVGTVFKWDGAAWQSQLPRPADPQHLGETWVESDKSIWVVGDYGTIRHFNGTSWKNHSTPTLAQLFAIAGVAGNDIWAAGEAGTMLHYDGQSWKEVPSGVDVDIQDLWADRNGTVIAAAGTFLAGAIVYNGTILRWNGAQWTRDSIPNVPTLTDLWGVSANDLWAVGDRTAMRFDGQKWTTHALEGPARLYGVWGTSPSSIWAVGENAAAPGMGGTIQYFNGQSWKEQTLPGSSPLLAVGGNDQAVWAVGFDGAIWRRALSVK